MRRTANLVLLSMSNVCFVEDERGNESNVVDGDFGSPPTTIFYYKPRSLSSIFSTALLPLSLRAIATM